MLATCRRRGTGIRTTVSVLQVRCASRILHGLQVALTASTRGRSAVACIYKSDAVMPRVTCRMK